MNDKRSGDFYKGHSIELVPGGEWIFTDTKELVRLTHKTRPCGHCNKPRTSAGQDFCLGSLPGVMNASCGYGDVDESYVQFLDGFCVRGHDAIVILGILKKWIGV
ncbi:hypothetical protein LCGC14_0782560 [marine sediment metagenome]|uniref:Uncharacterized protein n=1 Tax=marine sediment metagenome TaxID=412755 RepID=A0A0F9I507_9ZZZZ